MLKFAICLTDYGALNLDLGGLEFRPISYSGMIWHCHVTSVGGVSEFLKWNKIRAEKFHDDFVIENNKGSYGRVVKLDRKPLVDHFAKWEKKNAVAQAV